MERKSRNEQVDSKHIVKHKKDVFRLVAMLPAAAKFDLPRTIQLDIETFCQAIKDKVPNADFFKSTGLPNIDGNKLLEQLKNSFLHDK